MNNGKEGNTPPRDTKTENSTDTKQEFEQDLQKTTINGGSEVTTAGADKPVTREHKMYGDTELNKGLEAQAQDEEI